MSLPRKSSLHARRMIQKAFDDLKRAVSVTDANRFGDTTIQDVRKACESIENELGARGLLRNMGRLQPLLNGLQCYGNAVQTLCQGTPFLPWAWAPIVVILKVGRVLAMVLIFVRNLWPDISNQGERRLDPTASGHLKLSSKHIRKLGGLLGGLHNSETRSQTIMASRRLLPSTTAIS